MPDPEGTRDEIAFARSRQARTRQSISSARGGETLSKSADAFGSPHFIGLDVSVKETSVCVVDSAGVVVLEVKVPSEPEAVAGVLAQPAFCTKRVGLEAGPLSQWLYGELVRQDIR